jgi:GGDEF domain-containing protein
MSSPSSPAIDTSSELGLREEELTSMLLLLSSAVSYMAPRSPDLRQQIHTAQEILKGNPSVESLKSLRGDLAEALTSYYSDSQIARPASTVDGTTGLEGVLSFTGKIGHHVTAAKPIAVAVLVLDQLRALNARFGRAVGDRVLGLVAGDLSREFEDFGELHRWNGPAFALLANENLRTTSALDEQIKSVAAHRIEKTVAVEGRSIHFKISFSWETHLVQAGWSVATLTRMLDDYVDSRTGTPGGK